MVDKYDVICDLWKWLQVCSPDDIKSMRVFKEGENINAFKYDCKEQRYLTGFLINYGQRTPNDNAIVRYRCYRQAKALNNIAKNIWKIKHWQIRCDSYESIKNQKATWFIDPPYQHGGHGYVKSNKKIDFNSLSEWCIKREGQVIVCENKKAGWLPFSPMVIHNVRSGKYHEAIWTNGPSEYNRSKQGVLF